MAPGSTQRDVGHITSVIVWNTGSRLPGRLRKIDAAPAASCAEDSCGCRIVPRNFRNVGKSGTVTRIIRLCPRRIICFAEFGTAQSRNRRKAGWNIDGQSASRNCAPWRLAISCACVSTSRHNLDSLGICLLSECGEKSDLVRCEILFA